MLAEAPLHLLCMLCTCTSCLSSHPVPSLGAPAFQITGTFAAWPLPSTLTFFTVARNRLVGSLPSDWSPPRALTRLNFDNNQLTGDAMPTSMSLPNMEWYDASDNLFSGPLNANFTLSTSLKLLHLGGNQITGSIPALWALPPGLQRLNLSYNLLTGVLGEA